MLHQLNVDDLPNDGMKIVFMNPSGNEQRKALVKNIAMEIWHEASNFILKHKDIKEINPKSSRASQKLYLLSLVFKIGKCVRSPKSGQTCWLLEQAVPGRDENLLPRVVSIVKTKQRKPFFNFYTPLWKPEKSALFCHEMPDIFRICLRHKVNQLSLVIFKSQKSWKKKFLEFFQLCLFL